MIKISRELADKFSGKKVDDLFAKMIKENNIKIIPKYLIAQMYFDFPIDEKRNEEKFEKWIKRRFSAVYSAKLRFRTINKQKELVWEVVIKNSYKIANSTLLKLSKKLTQIHIEYMNLRDEITSFLLVL